MDDSLEALDQKVYEESRKSMSVELDVLNGILLHINHGLSSLTGVKNDRGLNFLAALLLHRAFATLWRAREDAAHGYPVQALILCRTALEDWATLRYVERHPKTHVLWLKGVLAELDGIEGRPPTMKTILSNLEGGREEYELLSWFVHPRGGGLTWLYHFDESTTHFHPAGYFSSRSLRTCLYFEIKIARWLLDPLAMLRHRVLGDTNSDWLSRGLQLMGEASSFIDGVHTELAAQPVVAAHSVALKELERY